MLQPGGPMIDTPNSQASNFCFVFRNEVMCVVLMLLWRSKKLLLSQGWSNYYKVAVLEESNLMEVYGKFETIKTQVGVIIMTSLLVPCPSFSSMKSRDGPLGPLLKDINQGAPIYLFLWVVFSPVASPKYSEILALFLKAL